MAKQTYRQIVWLWALFPWANLYLIDKWQDLFLILKQNSYQVPNQGLLSPPSQPRSTSLPKGSPISQQKQKAKSSYYLRVSPPSSAHTKSVCKPSDVPVQVSPYPSRPHTWLSLKKLDCSPSLSTPKPLINLYFDCFSNPILPFLYLQFALFLVKGRVNQSFYCVYLANRLFFLLFRYQSKIC